MDCTATRIPYRLTNAFSKIVLDYVAQENQLNYFFSHPPTISGIQKSIDERKKFNTNRNALVETLKVQYKGIPTSASSEKNIEILSRDTTFVITTAHQPNIFTGPLYFLYKILHAIRLAENCKTLLPAYDFVPVYYMGSEDADLDELGHFYINGEKKTWKTAQKGAVGRMKVDKGLLELVTEIRGQLVSLPHGEELLAMLTDAYKEGSLVQQATFKFVNALFAEWGLVVLIPDHPAMKSQMISLFEDELKNQTASGIVESMASKLESAGYKVQAQPREINLFYLENDLRSRIEIKSGHYLVHDTTLKFTEDEILKELNEHPEKFSPNVILRGLFQETILPGIAFIGGGGETAYWLQLKTLFEHYKIPFPVLVLRNSFLLIEDRWNRFMSKLGFTAEDIFLSEAQLVNKLVTRDSPMQLSLDKTIQEASSLYDQIKNQAVQIDSTLEKHVDALKNTSLKRLMELEKKMLRAEKRKFSDQQRQVHALKEGVFPHDHLQERLDNFMPYYAKWGKEFLQELYKHTLNLEQEFVIITEREAASY
jgi:bacillithiol biosynthesis cysteine-adding enzyme BshC